MFSFRFHNKNLRKYLKTCTEKIQSNAILWPTDVHFFPCNTPTQSGCVLKVNMRASDEFY